MQVFAWNDLYLVGLMILLEQILSADNALVLSLLIQPLDGKRRKKALLLGLVSGLVLRSLMIFGASYLISFFWIQIVGGVYLLYLSLIHLINRPVQLPIPTSSSLTRTIIKIELVDLFFAIDSILAAFALVSFTYPPSTVHSKLWIVYLGGLVGMAMMRFTTLGFSYLIDRFPSLVKIAFLAIGIIGGKMIYDGLAPMVTETSTLEVNENYPTATIVTSIVLI